MKTYYLFSSQFDTTAEVQASSPEKAITKFLSYLSDMGAIAHTERGSLRPFIRWSRTEPGEFNTDVQLGTTETVSNNRTAAEYTALPRQQTQLSSQVTSDEEDYYTGEESPIIAPSVLPPENVSAVPSEEDVNPVFGKSPIMNLSKQSRGF